jgi:HEAT repeat protein
MKSFNDSGFFSLLLTLVIVGAECCSAPGGQKSSSAGADVASLLERLKTGSVDEKVEAVVQLGASGPYAQPAVEPIVQLLQTENATLRYECLVALGHIGPLAHEYVDRLTPFLKSDDLLLQSAALESLRRIGAASPDAEVEIRRLCMDKDAAVATSAVRCLVMISGVDGEIVRNSIPRLVTALGDERPEVRNEAAVALAEIGSSVVPAVSAALSNPDRRVQVKASEILGQIGPAAASTVPLLVSQLEVNDELTVRAAATALGRIHANPETVLPALNRLLQSHSTAVRITAVRSIAEYGPAAKDSIPLILGLLSDKSVVLRASAADALGSIGEGRAEVVDALIKALADGSGSVTVSAANALSQLGPPAARALLPQLSDKRYQRLAVEVLGELGADAESAVPALVDSLSKVGEDVELRREIFIALASIGPKAAGATPALMKILEDPNAGDARAGAAYALAYIGEKKALPLMKQLVRSETSERVLRSAAWALVTLDPKNTDNVSIVMPHLIQATSSDMPLVRKEAISAFSVIGPPAIAALPELLKHAATDSDPGVRAESLHGLAEIKAPAAQTLPIAIASLSDPDPTVRNAARHLLGRLGKEAHGAAPQLRESLRKGDEFGRVLSAWALVHVEPSPENYRAAIPFLLTALQHPNPRVRAESATTLGTVGKGSREVLSALNASLDDEDGSVKDAVEKAIKSLNEK